MDICLLLTTRVVAEPSQLFAQALVLWSVQHGVVLAAVQRRPAPGALDQGRAVLRLDLARRVLALSDFPLSILRFFVKVGELILQKRDSK